MYGRRILENHDFKEEILTADFLHDRFTPPNCGLRIAFTFLAPVLWRNLPIVRI